jgi:flagellin-like hook-associated protein FlgL
MGTINDMVKRIRDLVVQAANDTNAHFMKDEATWSQSDRTRIQDEINQLMAEIDDQTLRTEFNTRRLLDGSLGIGFADGPGGSGGIGGPGGTGGTDGGSALPDATVRNVFALTDAAFRAFIAGGFDGAPEGRNIFAFNARGLGDEPAAGSWEAVFQLVGQDNDGFDFIEGGFNQVASQALIEGKINAAIHKVVGHEPGVHSDFQADVVTWLTEMKAFVPAGTTATINPGIVDLDSLFNADLALYDPVMRLNIQAARDAILDEIGAIDVSMYVEAVAATGEGPTDPEPLFLFDANRLVLNLDEYDFTNNAEALKAANAALAKVLTEILGGTATGTTGGAPGIHSRISDFMRWLTTDGNHDIELGQDAIGGLIHLTAGDLTFTSVTTMQTFMELLAGGRPEISAASITAGNSGSEIKIGGDSWGAAVAIVAEDMADRGATAATGSITAGDTAWAGITFRTAADDEETTIPGAVTLTGGEFAIREVWVDGERRIQQGVVTTNADDSVATITWGVIQADAADADGLSAAGLAIQNRIREALDTALRPFVVDDDAGGGGGGGSGSGGIEGSGNGLWFQIGANAGQGVTLNIEAVDVKALSAVGLRSNDDNIKEGFTFEALRTDDTNFSDQERGVLRQSGAEISKFITAVDFALSFTTAQRSNLGAMQNRLEFTIDNLHVSSENLSAAESRIRDADMALEMMRFTQSNILQQAAISMLAQANQAPNMILSLLR